MKKLYSLSLILLLCSCSRGGDSASTKFYNPDISFTQMLDAVEISESEFKAEVDAHYVKPSSRYEHMKCVLTSDKEFDIYGGMIFNSLNAYFSLLNTLPNLDDESTNRLFIARADFEGTLFGPQADIYYWHHITYMPDIYEMMSLKKDLKFYKSPYVIEYGRNDGSESVRIAYDDNFLPVQVERSTPTNDRIHMWHYDFAYFSSNDVKTGSGEVNKEAFAEHYMKLCNNAVFYKEYTVHIKGKYPLYTFDPVTLETRYDIVDIDKTFNGQIKLNRDGPSILSNIHFDYLDTDVSTEDNMYYVYNSFVGIENMASALHIIPEYQRVMFKYFDSPLRIEGHGYTQQDDDSWKMDSDRRYYFEYNNEGLIKQYINRKYDNKGTRCDLEYTFTYK